MVNWAELPSKIGKAVADSAMLLRPLGKKEKFDVYRLSKYLEEEELKHVKALIKQKKISIDVKKLGYTFMVSGVDLLPILISGDPVVIELNQKIEQKHYIQQFDAFKERAWTILPYYIDPNTPGLLTEKRLALLRLFTEHPIHILFIGDGEGVVRSAEVLRSSKGLEWIKTKPKALDHHLVFHAKKANLKKFSDLAENIILQSSTEINSEDIRFIRRYIDNALKIEVTIPKGLDQRIKTFVIGLMKKSAMTVECIVELAKASARLELRDKVEIKDLDRVFEIVKSAVNV